MTSLALQKTKEETRMSKTAETQKINKEKSLELVKDPGLKKLLTNILDKVPHEDIYKEAEEVKKKIIKSPKRPEQTIFSFIPHEMAKVSIFFPMSKKELKEDRRLIQKLENESNWGKIIVEGVKLAIFEEDVFLALMKIAKDKRSYLSEPYMIKTTMPEIAKLLYGHAGYTERVYELIIRSFKHFQLIRFEIALKGDKKPNVEGGSIGNIIQSFYPENPTRDVKIYFNPHFCIYFLKSMFTGINFTLRRQLKKDGSKALMRFLATHTRPKRMHLLTVLNAINYNTNQPMYALRRKFKQFTTELKKNKVLGPKTKLYSDDTVYFDVLQRKKILAE